MHIMSSKNVIQIFSRFMFLTQLIIWQIISCLHWEMKIIYFIGLIKISLYEMFCWRFLAACVQDILWIHRLKEYSWQIEFSFSERAELIWNKLSLHVHWDFNIEFITEAVYLNFTYQYLWSGKTRLRQIDVHDCNHSLEIVSLEIM